MSYHDNLAAGIDLKEVVHFVTVHTDIIGAVSDDVIPMLRIPKLF